MNIPHPTPEEAALKMNSGQIQRAVSRHFDPQINTVIPNCCTKVAWEADLLVVRKSGWAEEIEIKISAADFRREFTTKPLKHRTLVEGSPKLRKSWEAGFKLRDLENPDHVPLGPGGHAHSMYHDFSECEPHIVKRFWYAMPEELAEKMAPEVPEYAGLFAIKQGHYGLQVVTLKPAPSLKQSRKVTDDERAALYRVAYFRFWDLKRELERKEAA